MVDIADLLLLDAWSKSVALNSTARICQSTMVVVDFHIPPHLLSASFTSDPLLYVGSSMAAQIAGETIRIRMLWNLQSR